MMASTIKLFTYQAGIRIQKVEAIIYNNSYIIVILID